MGSDARACGLLVRIGTCLSSIAKAGIAGRWPRASARRDRQDAIGNHDVYLHIRVIIGVVLGLGLTRILSGVARIVQHPGSASSIRCI
jgi:hypothetical protein